MNVFPSAIGGRLFLKVKVLPAISVKHRCFDEFSCKDYNIKYNFEICWYNIHALPEKRMFFLSWLTARGSGTASINLITETDSPVRRAWSTRRVVLLISCTVVHFCIQKTKSWITTSGSPILERNISFIFCHVCNCL